MLLYFTVLLLRHIYQGENPKVTWDADLCLLQSDLPLLQPLITLPRHTANPIQTDVPSTVSHGLLAYYIPPRMASSWAMLLE